MLRTMKYDEDLCRETIEQGRAVRDRATNLDHDSLSSPRADQALVSHGRRRHDTASFFPAHSASCA